MNDKAKEMEEIFLKRVTVCQDNLYHAKRKYEQSMAELSRAQADLVLWQNSFYGKALRKENV